MNYNSFIVNYCWGENQQGQLGIGENLNDQITAQDVLGLEESIPESFALYQNYPNPFNPKTTISYQLSGLSEIELTIYDLLGQKVAILAKGEQYPGTYKYEWDASNFSNGIYFYKLQIKNGFQKTSKMLLIK